MRSHRIIWVVAAVSVLLAAVVLTLRSIGGGRPETAGEVAPGSPAELVAAMKSALQADPPMEKAGTRAAVEAVAKLVESAGLTSAEGYYALGLHRADQGAFDAAESAFRKAIALKPEWSWPHNSLGMLLAYHTQNRAAEAEAAFHTAIRLEPKWGRPYNDLAILLRLSGRLQEAEKPARMALKLDPNSTAAHNNYGNLLVALKKLDEAETEYRKAIELDPSHPKPYYNLACVYSLEGRKDEAVENLARAIALNPTLRDDARRDPDFEPVSASPEFARIMQGAAKVIP